MSGRSKTVAVVVLGGEPRANLLPPEVGKRAKARATRRLLVVLVVLSLVAVAAGYAAAYLRAADAQAGLLRSQGRTEELLAEQLKYSEATTVVGLVAATKSARQIGSSTEILWADLLNTITSYLPEGSTLDSGTLTGRTPWEPALMPVGPLRAPRVATLSLIVKSSSLLDTTAIIRKLAELPGFADATPDLVELDGGGYKTTITLNVNEDALSGRFPADGTEATK